jgi:PKD repeat protein
MAITWYRDGLYPDTGYSDGMKLVWFADDNVNPWGIHAFGNYDWHEAAAPEYWYYYTSGTERYPTTTGLSVKYIRTIEIFSNQEPPPLVGFNANSTSGTVPLTVKFTDSTTGTGPFTYAWDFTNDGIVDSTFQSPMYTYSTAGTYTVKLTVTNAGGSDSEVKSNYISVQVPLPPAPVANFNANITSGTTPLAVEFTDTTTGTGPFTYAWDFTNDGIVDSTFQSPMYTYSTAGTYTVKLTVTNAGGSDSEVKSNYISVQVPLPPVPVANFTATPTTGTAPLTVQFTDASTGATSWSWVFGDGGTSTSQNPSHSYMMAGTYNATLTVTNPGGSSSKELQIPVTISPPVADFTATPTTGTVPLTVQFTDASTGATSWSWAFGDGGTSTSQNPSHMFTSAGIYDVTVTVRNAGFSSTLTKSQYIIIRSPGLYADFTVTPTNGIAPMIVQCTDKSIGNPTRYSYNFGDGTTVAGPNPFHTYRYPGTYNITLTITKYNSTTNSIMGVSTTKTDVITVNSVPVVVPVAKFTASPTRGAAPLTVTFTDQSTGNPTRYNYNFGDGYNVTEPNPTHIYRYPGIYNVTLTVLKYERSRGVIFSNTSVQKDLIVVDGT